MSDNERLVLQNQTAFFSQPGGAGSPRYFFGVDTSLGYITGVSIARQGEITPRWVPNPRRPGSWQQVSSSVGAPGQNTFTALLMEEFKGLSNLIFSGACAVNFYEVHGRCNDLSDLYNGGQTYAYIYANARKSGSIELGDRTTAEGSEPLAHSVPMVADAIYPAVSINIASENDASVSTPVQDIMFAMLESCADCGVANNGSQTVYAITETQLLVGQRLGTPNKLWTTGTLPAGAPGRHVRATNSLIVVYTTTGLFHVYPLTASGTPGAVASSTMAGTGLVISDVYMSSARNVIFIGSTTTPAANFIAVQPDVTSNAYTQVVSVGVPLTRLAGIPGTMLVGGNTAFLAVSRNEGFSWSTLTPPSGAASLANVTALEVVNSRYWIVGDSTGKIIATRDAGATWSVLQSSDGVLVQDIKAATGEVIHAITGPTAGQGTLRTSIDGGFSWTTNANPTWRVLNSPTLHNVRRLAVPRLGDVAITANTLGIAAATAAGADGLLLIGSPTSF